MTTGFRTLSRWIPPGTLSAARTLLKELGPVPVGSWTSLASICDTAWLPAVGRSSPALARVARRRLRVLATAPLSFAAFARLEVGEGPVHVSGTCDPLPGGDELVWRVETAVRKDGARRLLQQGNDFLLRTPDGERVRVLAAGGLLVNGDLHVGDAVSVFGFADEIADSTGMGPSAHGRGGLTRALRSGSALPLLVARIEG